MSLCERTRPGPGVIEPCLPSPERRLGDTTRFALLLMYFLAASSTKAQIPQDSSLTGNWLYTVCGANDQRGQTICRMWISGFQAGIISSQKLAQTNKLKPASCIPSDLTEDQAKLSRSF